MISHLLRYCFGGSLIYDIPLIYEVNSPFLCRTLKSDDKISVREVKSLVDSQLNLFTNHPEL